MTKKYSPLGKYMWDTWFALDGDGVYHAFYLESELGDTRFAKPTIGHAKSVDLRNWEEVGTALKPGKKGSWDDLALWTGSVFKKDKKWYLFYTGRNAQNEWDQAIGVAVSDDLLNWTKYDKPVLTPGDSRYSPQKGFNEIDNPPAWRDPFVFFDKKTGLYNMFFTARVNNGKTSFNGCIGRATSKDLFIWRTEAPIYVNEAFDEMEVPQLIYENSKYYLLFSYRKSHKHKGKPKLSSGLYCMVSNEIDCNYRPIKGWYGQIKNYKDKYYGMRLIRPDGNKHYVAIGWHFLKRGKFVGNMTNPYKVRLEPVKFDLAVIVPKIVNSLKKK